MKRPFQIGLLLFFAALPGRAVPIYTVTALPLGPFSLGPEGEGLSSNGKVTGAVNGRGFLWDGGPLIDLGTLGGTGSPGFGVNAGGQVTGWSWHTDNIGSSAYLYSNGVMTDLGPLVGGISSLGLDVNDSGVVVGYQFYEPNHSHAFRLAGEVATDLGTLGGLNSSARAVSQSGLITGGADTAFFTRDAYIYSTGTGMISIGRLGGTFAAGEAINDFGQVAGTSHIAGDAATHAFLYTAGTMLDLQTLGGLNSSGLGINSAGWVVGGSDLAGGGNHAFLYANGIMFDLNELLVSAPGVTLFSAGAINDTGLILANGTDGVRTRAFLLTPSPPADVPEPSTLLLLSGGLVLAFAWVRVQNRKR